MKYVIVFVLLIGCDLPPIPIPNFQVNKDAGSEEIVDTDGGLGPDSGSVSYDAGPDYYIPDDHVGYVVKDNCVSYISIDTTELLFSMSTIVMMYFRDIPIKLDYKDAILSEDEGHLVYLWELDRGTLFLQTKDVPQDYWDNIQLEIEDPRSTVVLKILIRHNTQDILYWNKETFIKNYWSINFTNDIRLYKQIGLTYFNIVNPPEVLLIALNELGKTDWRKYRMSKYAYWCTEFSSWAYSMAGYDTPSGIIGYPDLLDVFDKIHIREDIINGVYTPKPGDFLTLDTNLSGSANHSAIYITHNEEKVFHVSGNTSCGKDLICTIAMKSTDIETIITVSEI